MGEKKGKREEMRERIREILQSRMDVEAGLWFQGSLVEIRGQERIEIHGARKILSYGSQEIVLSLGKKKIRIKGQRLVCQSFLRGVAVIGGLIDAVAYEGDGGKTSETV